MVRASDSGNDDSLFPALNQTSPVVWSNLKAGKVVWFVERMATDSPAETWRVVSHWPVVVEFERARSWKVPFWVGPGKAVGSVDMDVSL